MNYIYCITNQINGKRYIGKTTDSIQERFKEHCRDSKKERCNKRPLYDAMNKYGIENFIIEELEQIEDDSILSEREIYWIQELQTYGKNGYNATKGGDGKILYDHKEIIELYNLGYNTPQIADKMKCDRTTVLKVLKANGLTSRGYSKMIKQYDKAGNYIQTFNTPKEAAQWIIDYCEEGKKIETISNAIRKVCRGERKFAYNYKWMEVTPTE